MRVDKRHFARVRRAVAAGVAALILAGPVLAAEPLNPRPLATCPRWRTI